MDLSERPAPTSLTTTPAARHPWEVARARFFIELIARTGAPSRVLDVGAGDAYVAHQLLEKFAVTRIVAWDDGYSDADIAQLTNDRLRATRARPDGAAGGAPFDLALLLDVLEHLDDDAAGLRSVVSLLSPDARVIVSVPAWPGLFGAHDIQLRHRRRYTPRECRALLEGAGLKVVEGGGLFHSLLVPRWAALKIEAATAITRYDGVGGWRAPAPVSALVGGALRVDNALSRAAAAVGVDVPGLSFWALCRVS